ncbi:hypothetical protein Gohar_003845 [Gossypium harknessii]|uniref:C2H2-type domain-containing protein n=1 Tax=Gossypium harknessii TaxID=34285 RepID=A0A7J9H3R3_9ROSI|nr:hypothetical protein [Gossypium harknessii]
MFPTAMSNSTSLSEEASTTVSSCTRVVQDFCALIPIVSTISPQQQPQNIKKKRSLPGNPDPDAEVIALSPKTLLATNRFVCEICNKGFQRDQNLQLHRRGHNLPWKLKQRNNKEIKKRAYVCPEPTCVHHHPSRALAAMFISESENDVVKKIRKTVIKSGIHGCACMNGSHHNLINSSKFEPSLHVLKDSFITHRAFCDALAEESARLSANQLAVAAATNPALHHLTSQANPTTNPSSLFPFETHISLNPWVDPAPTSNPNPNNPLHVKPESHHLAPFFQEALPPQKTLITSPLQSLHVSNNAPSIAAAATSTSPHLSATALLQKAATVGATATQINNNNNGMDFFGFASGNLATWQKSSDRFTRDFLGLTGDHHQHHGGGGGNGNVSVSMNVKDVLTYAGQVELQQHFERDHSLLKPQGFGFTEPASETWADC